MNKHELRLDLAKLARPRRGAPKVTSRSYRRQQRAINLLDARSKTMAAIDTAREAGRLGLAAHLQLPLAHLDAAIAAHDRSAR